MDTHKLSAALDYLLWTAPSYCQWVDGCNAVVWIDGPTIAFRQELAVVFARQEQKGLPPLGATLILLSACRESWQESHATLIRYVSELSCVERYMPDWIGEVLTALDAVHALPRELVQSVDGKAELVDYVFDSPGAPRTTADLAVAVAQFLHSGSSAVRMETGEPAFGDLWRELGTLRDCLRKFDPQAFAQRVRTGIERPLQPAEADLPPGERVRALLATLLDDPELGGVARMAKQLLAAVSLPRPLAEPDEMPLGGVTDIANRGTLDRLLVSELANDDLTLAVRVATSEALYLRREQPPRSPPLKRAILLDSGVRLWGVPRVMATALGMAFSAAADKQLEVQAFRASGRLLSPVDLTRRQGIESHLAALEPEAHVGGALSELLKTIDDDKLAADAVLITSQAALQDEEFCRQMRESQYEGWIAAVERDGHVRLWQARGRGLIPLRELRLDLESLLAKTAKAQPPLLREDPRDLPAYCRLVRQPLRVPHELSLEKAWHVPGQGVLAIHKDYRLTLWNDEKLGPLELADNMPIGSVHWVDPRPGEDPHYAVIGKLSKRGLHLLRVSFEDRELGCCRALFPLVLDFGELPLSVTGDGVYVYVMSARTVNVFTRDGQRVARGDLPAHFVHLRHRYFRNKHDYVLHVLVCNGTSVEFTQIYSAPARAPTPLMVLRPGGSEEELLLNKDGSLIPLLTGARRRVVSSEFGEVASVGPISRDDRFVSLRTTNSRCAMLLDVQNGRTLPSAQANQAIEPEVMRYLGRTVTLRRHFRGICVTDAGQLALLSRKERLIVLGTHDRKLILHDTVPSRPLPAMRTFHATTAPSGYLLQVAEWDDGSRAWLDSRGLLHLRSSDTRIPELTLVLHEGLVAGWCSDGRMFGNAHFLPRDNAEPEMTPRIIVEVLAPFMRGLR